MKKRPFLMVVLVFLGIATLQRCSDHDVRQPLEKVQFTCSLKSFNESGGRLKQDQLPDVLILSLERSTGEPVFTNKKINLLRVGDSFMTEPLEVQPGTYRITDFLLAVGDTTVIYITPRSGSPLARAVSHPLPYQMSVVKNRVSNIDMEVIDVDGHAPEDFGYASFSVNVVNPLSVAVMIKDGTHTTLASADAYLVEGDDTLKHYSLRASVNLIGLRGDTHTSRKLIISKPGYNSVVREFVYEDLINELDGHPLAITLVQSLFLITPFFEAGQESLPFEMDLGGMPGNISVNWGDGNAGNYVLGGPDVTAKHTYSTAGNFQITVTGDLDKITRFYSFYGYGPIDAINLQGLTALRDVRLGFTHGPEVIDLSQSPNVSGLMMPVVHQLRKIILAENSSLHNIDITGPNQLDTQEINYLIDRIYERAVLNHSIYGALLINRTYSTNDMIGPPSPDRIAKLRELSTDYLWHITPDPRE